MCADNIVTWVQDNDEIVYLSDNAVEIVGYTAIEVRSMGRAFELIEAFMPGFESNYYQMKEAPDGYHSPRHRVLVNHRDGHQVPVIMQFIVEKTEGQVRISGTAQRFTDCETCPLFVQRTCVRAHLDERVCVVLRKLVSLLR